MITPEVAYELLVQTRTALIAEIKAVPSVIHPVCDVQECLTQRLALLEEILQVKAVNRLTTAAGVLKPNVEWLRS